MSNSSETSAATPPAPSGRGPIAWFLNLFSSVKLGIVLLSLLFIYASMGSSGLPIGSGVLKWPSVLRPDAWVSVREVFELSEFQWFHWWPFDLLIGLICLNLITATLRRIPFNVVNLGVWMIHTGIIILAIGSVWYFATKVEGDTPVPRRQIAAALGDGPTTYLVASPGRTATVSEGANAYRLQVRSITPDWELLSGEDEGKRAYKVSVGVDGPQGSFIRELIAGFPEYTEDLIFTENAEQPVQRAKKALGTPLVDENLRLGLEYAPQRHVYVMETAALYLREVGADEWVQRPIDKLPRFKDYVSDYDLVWTDPAATPPLRPLEIEVGADAEDDPAPDVTFRITNSLRYASMQRMPGGTAFDPYAVVRFENDAGQRQDYEMLAFDPQSNTQGEGKLIFRWIERESDFARFTRADPPMLRVAANGADVNAVPPVLAAPVGEEGPYTPIEGTEFEYRVRAIQDELNVGSRVVSVAIVDVRRGDETFTRWVFDDPALTRDLDDSGAPGQHGSALRAPEVAMRYTPAMPSGLRLIGGPERNQLRLLLPAADGGFDLQDLRVGQVVPLQAGITLAVRAFSPFSDVRPFIEPPIRRNRDVGVQASMIRVHVPAAGGNSWWLPYHQYPFAAPEQVIRRFPYRPTRMVLNDGREIEVMFSRERRLLPRPVVLEDFEFDSHIGGFSGATTSVRNWTSVLRFEEAPGAWGETRLVSVNAPQEDQGYWYFQSQWDPPSASMGPGDPGSAGLNYTVLGVGNRNGVVTQLMGCIIAVIGMIYAFYVKPTIKRRRQEAIYAAVAAERAGHDVSAPRAPSAVGAGMEETV